MNKKFKRFIIARNNRKAGVPIAILLLVILILVLVGYSLITFNKNTNLAWEKIYVVYFLQDVYAREEMVNYYLQGIAEKAAGDAYDGFRELIEEAEEVGGDDVSVANVEEELIVPANLHSDFKFNFTENFKKYLNEFKDTNDKFLVEVKGEFEQVEEQLEKINLDNDIDFDGQNLSMSIEILLDNKVKDEESKKEIFSATYSQKVDIEIDLSEIINSE